ncbi:MAG: hypothetical protein IPP72_20750 [Chitinophagaceae bacterium]|nr:hypothetical protein [Chitinophagaceae bacterium]
MKLIVSIAFCFVSLLAVAQTNTLSKAGYDIKYPDSWLVEPGADARQFTIKAPADSGLIDNFVENLNMVINDISGYDAKQYAAFSKGYPAAENKTVCGAGK